MFEPNNQSLAGIGSLLKQSKDKLSGCDDFTHLFFDWFGSRIGDSAKDVANFNLGLELAYSDLLKGRSEDGFGRPIPRGLVRQSPSQYAALLVSMNRYIAALLPSEFAEAILAERRDVQTGLAGRSVR